jgi:hypothetical protein
LWKHAASCEDFLGKPEERDDFEDLGVHSRMMRMIMMMMMMITTILKRLLGRRRWVNNIKMDRREIGWGGMNWIVLDGDGDQ